MIEMSTRTCRACYAATLAPVLDLGITPLANSLIPPEGLEKEERRHPLELVFCKTCSLVQITATVPPEDLFRDYAYFSSFSDTTLDHSRRIVDRLVQERGLCEESLVVEVASNDGYLLQYYVEKDIPVLGIEPALNIASVARERGIETISEFFGADLAAELKQQGFSADVIHANNVLAHVPDLNGVVEGLEILLREEGIAVIEVPYVRDMVENLEFDTIYHEHLCYFSLTALVKLFQKHGLAVIDVERLSIHGGSLRLFASPTGQPGRSVLEMLREESAVGVNQLTFYRSFEERVEALKSELCSLLGELRAAGNSIAVYGASAKGSTLLNCFNIGKGTLDFVVDRSTVKQGMYTPGTHLEIRTPEELLKAMPDYVLLLTWNFADEIMRQQSEYLRAGGRFIVPLPRPQIVFTPTAIPAVSLHPVASTVGTPLVS